MGDERATRAFELYRTGAARLGRLHGALVGVGAGFVLLILIPYVSIEHEHARVDAALAVLAEEGETLERRVEALERLEARITELRDEVRAAPDSLRTFILALEDPPGDPVQLPGAAQVGPVQTPQVQQAAELDGCRGLAGDEWAACRVDSEIERIYRSFDRILGAAVREHEATAVTVVDPEELTRGLQGLRRDLEEVLADDPRFWETVPGKEAFSNALDRRVEAFRGPLGSHLETTSRELEVLRGERRAVSARARQLAAERDRLAERLERAELPFGGVPLGLPEAIAVFPLLLAGGAVGMAASLEKLTRFRNALAGMARAPDGAPAVSEAEIELASPFLLAREAPGRGGARALLLHVPAVLYVVSVGVVLYGWWVGELFGAGGPFTQWIYGVLYLVGAAGLVHAHLRIARIERERRGGAGTPAEERA